MKQIKLILLFVFAISTTYGQIRLSDLNNKSEVSGTEKIPVSGSGNPSITGNLLKSFINSGLATASGTDTYTATTVEVYALSKQPKVAVKFTNANTGASTFNLNGLGAVTLRKANGDALTSGDIEAGSVWLLAYDGTASQWRLIGGSGPGTSLDLGTGVETALGVNIGSAGAVIVNGGAGGTPSSLTGTNITGIPESGVTNLTSDLAAKQATLVSATNIKTINGSSILGSGDLTISGGVPSTRTITTNDTPTTSDAGNLIEYNNTTTANITIQPVSTGLWASDTYLNFVQKGTGKFTIVAGVGVSFINYSGTLISAGQGAFTGMKYIGSNVWYVWNGAPGLPSLTDGSALFYSSTAANISQDNASYFWDIGNKRLGIGLNTPASDLEIRNNTLTLTPSINVGLTLSNTATASSSNSKMAPPMYFNGKVWQTTAGASQDLSFRIHALPVEGNSSTVDGQLFISAPNINGAGYTNKFMVHKLGFGNPEQTVRVTASAIQLNLIQRLNTAVFTIDTDAGISSGGSLAHTATSSYQQASGEVGHFRSLANTVMASGTAIWYNTKLDGTLNDVGTGDNSMLLIKPTYTNIGGDVHGIYYDPTVTSVTGKNYFLRATSGIVALPQTITAGGTTGDRTINKITGTVNIAATGTSVTVTNSTVTTSSIVYAVVRTNDSTALIKNVVCSSGSFVITMNAAVTAETSIGFVVFN